VSKYRSLPFLQAEQQKQALFLLCFASLFRLSIPMRTKENIPMPTNQSDTITAAVEMPSDLSELDFGAAGEEPVAVPITRQVHLKWLNRADTVDGATTTGVHLEADINPLIDQICQGADWAQRVDVEHRTPDRDGNTHKVYWKLNPCSLIVVCDGVLMPFQMRDTPTRTGVVYAMETEFDENGQPKRYEDGERNIVKHKVLKMRCYVRELVVSGYREWIPFRLSGHIVDAMLEALAKQMSVLDVYYSYAQRRAPFYGFAIPIVPSPTKKMVGPKGKQSPIYPPLAAIPEQIDKAYLLQHAVPKALIEHIYEIEIKPAIAWSIEESARIGAGSAQAQLPAGPGSRSQLPAGPMHGELVTPAQIKWIRQTYCGDNEDVLQGVLEYFAEQTQQPIADVSQLRVEDFNTLRQMKRKAAAEMAAAQANS
jgi:hypothetical protein